MRWLAPGVGSRLWMATSWRTRGRCCNRSWQRHDRPTVMACLYGDRAAQSLGYRPQGLGDYAGLALALHQARAEAPAT